MILLLLGMKVDFDGACHVQYLLWNGPQQCIFCPPTGVYLRHLQHAMIDQGLDRFEMPKGGDGAHGVTRDGKNCIDEAMLSEIGDRYGGEDLDTFKNAALIEARYYMEKTRLEELILFAREMKYRKLGMAFCIGMENEARIIHNILKSDFEVHSVCCKVCGLDKDDFQLERINSEASRPQAIP